MYKSLIALLLIFSATALQAENNYSGFYLGATLGYVDGEDKTTESLDGEINGYTSKTTPKGWLLSALGGYNWVLQNNILLGIEGDLDYRNADDRSDFFNDGDVDPDYSVESDLKYAASLRGRLGYLLKNDKTLVYATAGLGAANIKRTYFDNDSEISQSSTDTQTGIMAGFGLEQSISDVLSIQAEYRYADYGDKAVSTDEVYGSGYSEEQKYTEQSLRIGVVYHF